VSGWNAELGRLVASSEPLAVVLYRATSQRDELRELAELLLPAGRRLVMATRVDDLFAPEHLDAVIALLLPTHSDEVDAVRRLERDRDSLLVRRAPGLLFLLAEGSAVAALREAPALASWLRGREFDASPDAYDPERERPQDFDEAREEFARRIGRLPEQWLDAWRGGTEAHDLLGDLLAVEAERLALDDAP